MNYCTKSKHNNKIISKRNLILNIVSNIFILYSILNHALDMADEIDANTILVIHCVWCHKWLQPSFDGSIFADHRSCLVWNYFRSSRPNKPLVQGQNELMVYDLKQVDVDREKTMEKLISCGFWNKAVNWIMLSITN